MKAIVLLITTLLILGICSLFCLKTSALTEQESVKNICAISEKDSDYIIDIKDAGKVYRNGEKREAFIGNYENGLAFDGETAYEYIDGEKRQITAFPFNTYDSYAEELLADVQKIISNKLYSAYNDKNPAYKNINYYFLISPEGLLVFNDQPFSYGLIVCVYRNSIFQEVELQLSRTKDGKSDVRCTFGEFDYEINLSPDTITITHPS